MADIPREPSQTAVLSAAGRALYLEEPPPHILEDRFAELFAGDQGADLIRELKSRMPAAQLVNFRRWTTVRARYTEDAVDQALEGGIIQYAILGAGLDSFAYRRSDLQNRLRVYEVDHPGSQEWKRRRLQKLGVEIPANLVFAPVDFERQTMRDGLQLAGFDFSTRSILSWIGVTMYLTRGAIEATLRDVASCARGSRVVLSYDVRRETLSPAGQALQDSISRRAAEMGEPFLSRMDPSEVDELLSSLGFVDIHHFGSDDAVDRFFKGRRDARFEGPQRLAEATVGQ